MAEPIAQALSQIPPWLPGLAGMALPAPIKALLAGGAAAAGALYGPARLALDEQERQRAVETAAGVADFLRQNTLAGRLLFPPPVAELQQPSPFTVYAGEGVTPVTAPFTVLTGGGLTPVGLEVPFDITPRTVDRQPAITSGMPLAVPLPEKIRTRPQAPIIQAFPQSYAPDIAQPVEAPPLLWPPGLDVQVVPPQFVVGLPEFVVQSDGQPPEKPPERPSWDTMPWWLALDVAARATKKVGELESQVKGQLPETYPGEIEPAVGVSIQQPLPAAVGQLPETYPGEIEPAVGVSIQQPLPAAVGQLQLSQRPSVIYPGETEPQVLVAPASLVRARELPPLVVEPETRRERPQRATPRVRAGEAALPREAEGQPLLGTYVPQEPSTRPQEPATAKQPERQPLEVPIERLFPTPEAMVRVRQTHSQLEESGQYIPQSYQLAPVPEPLPVPYIAPSTFAPPPEVEPVPYRQPLEVPIDSWRSTPEARARVARVRPVAEARQLEQIGQMPVVNVMYAPEPQPSTPRPYVPPVTYAPEPTPVPVPPGRPVVQPTAPYVPPVTYAPEPTPVPVPPGRPVVQPTAPLEVPVDSWRSTPEARARVRQVSQAKQGEEAGQPLAGRYVSQPTYRQLTGSVTYPELPKATGVIEPYTASPAAPSRVTAPVMARGSIQQPPSQPPTVRGQVGRPAPVEEVEEQKTGRGAIVPPPPEQPQEEKEPVQDPITGWTDREWRETTGTIIGREIGAEEMSAWLRAFAAEHDGRYPWEVGPGDAANNLIDHLLALRESREVVRAEGQQAITPQWWERAHAERYGLAPGETRQLWAPYQLAQRISYG